MTERTLEIWTIQLARHRLLNNTDLKLIDITVKSGIHVFAPRRQDLYQYKAGHMSEAEYTEHYLAKMAQSQKDYPHYWRRLLAYSKSVYACYCPAGAFCHRHLFKHLVQEYAQGAGYTVTLRGEYGLGPEKGVKTA